MESIPQVAAPDLAAPPAWNARAEVERLGSRAVRAVEKLAAGRDWSPDLLWLTARALERGERSVGVRRPWPRLAAGLKRVSATWWLRKGRGL